MGIPLDQFRNVIAASQDEPATVSICRGGDVCEGEPGTPCRWCYVVDSDDPRSTDEILTDMNRQH